MTNMWDLECCNYEWELSKSKKHADKVLSRKFSLLNYQLKDKLILSMIERCKFKHALAWI